MTKSKLNLKAKKNSRGASVAREVEPLEALQFLEDLRLLSTKVEGPKKMISIRLPEKIIDSLKIKAASKNMRYQTLIVMVLRDYLLKSE